MGRASRSLLQCCVPCCPQTGTMLYRFPIPEWESHISHEWIIRIGNENMYSTDESRLYTWYRVCDLHFSEHCRVPDKTRLKKGSLPTLLLPYYQGPSDEEASLMPDINKPPATAHVPIKEEPEEVPSEEFPQYPLEPDPIKLEPREENFEIQEKNSTKEKTRETQKPVFDSLKGESGLKNTLYHICRVCFKANKDDDLIKLYEENKETVEIKMMMTTVLPDLNQDLYPNIVICLKCKIIIVSSYNLREMSLKTEETLKEIFKEENYSLKLENNEDTCLIIPEEGTPMMPDHNYSKQKKLLKKPEFTEEDYKRARIIRMSKNWGGGPYLCEQCGAVCTYVTSFKRHLLNHSIITKWTGICELCGKMFRSNSGFRKHFRGHYNKRQMSLTCDICGKSFRTFKGIQSHGRKSHKQYYIPYRPYGKILPRTLCAKPLIQAEKT